MEISESMIKKYRHYNVEHIEWWDATYEYFKEQMAQCGIDVDRMFFSGFWSQGDGACFEGRIDDMQLFLDTHFKPREYTAIRKLMEHGGTIYCKVEHSGHYYHENCTCFKIGGDSFSNCLDTPTTTHEQVVEALDSVLANEMIDFEEASVAIFKGYMKKLYRDLEKEYDYLTSDAAVKEAIVANELTNDEGEE